MTVTATENERINLRLKYSAKRLIERAATFEGKTLSSFILSSALASAEKTVQEHESSRLGEEDAQRFFDALAKPVGFNEKLTHALLEHDRRVEGHFDLRDCVSAAIHCQSAVEDTLVPEPD